MGDKRTYNIREEDLRAYLENGLSQVEISKIYGCVSSLISYWVKKYNIEYERDVGGRAPHPEAILTDEQNEVIIGALLGDGSIPHEKTTSPKRNNKFVYGTSVESHANYIGDFIKEYLTPICKDGATHHRYFKKQTNKYYDGYTITTQYNVTFKRLHNKWYSNGIKRIPDDTKLTPLICLVWYIGDGYLDKKNQYIKLCTNCFEKDNIENTVLPQMRQFDARLKKTDKGQFVIIIPRKRVKRFLQFTGSCPIEEMKYKWDYREYKYKKCMLRYGDDNDQDSV